MDRLLLGVGRFMIPVPRVVWLPMVRSAARRSRAGLGFMSEDHHRVRDFAVLELARTGRPLAPESIANALGLAPDRVRTILDELERGLTFLFRNERGEVTWAYPITVDPTEHRAHFRTGEDAFSP